MRREPRCRVGGLCVAPAGCHAGHVAALPTGVVSFVLTDVVDSTALWERAPDEMTVALARHEELVTAAVDGAGGTVLKARGEGDSTFSVFTRATDALRAAHRLQAAVRAERWPAAAVIRVRAAVHTGEAVERDGDYFGLAVNRVARLRGTAHGGEVMVSAATAAIVSGALPVGWDLVDVGTVELRGLGPQPALLLAAPELDPVRRRRRSTPDGGISRREGEVLDLVVESRSNAEIAAALFISERTVESHVSSLRRKLDASDRRDLVRRARARPAPEDQVATALLPPALELLADPAAFVGRIAERDVLRDRWRLAVAGHTLLVVVAAEAGMGKSRLVAELAADVHADGGRVLFGACYEDVEQPYGPFAQVIADAVDGGAVGAPVEVASVLPGATRPATPRTDDLAAPAAVIDGIRQWLMTAAASAPTLLVLEDLHWSTATTRDVVRQLVRTAGRARLLVVATTRDTAPDLDVDLATLLADLERSPAVTRLGLRGLDRDEVAALVGVVTDDADAIIADTGGNPLLVSDRLAEGRPGSLSALLARRDALLDERARGLLDLAATFGAEFDAHLLATGCGVPLLDVLESLEAAEAAGLVAPLPGRPGRFAFVHSLFRSHRYDTLSFRRRLDLHARAASALASPFADGRLSERARHACLAVPVGDASTAVALACDAAHEAEHAYAYGEAVAHYERAIVAARSLDPPDTRTTQDLTARLGAALVRRGDPRGVPMLVEVAERARRDGDTAALVRAASSFSHFGATSTFATVDPAPLQVVEAALEALGGDPTATRARLMIEKACQIGGVKVEEAIGLATEAEAIARRLGDADVLGQVLLGARLVGRHPSRLSEHERIATELERLGETLPSLLLKLAGTLSRGGVHRDRGELLPWTELAERATGLLGDRSLPFFQLDALVYRATRAYLHGDFERAEEELASMTPLALAIRHPPVVWWGAIVYANRRMQGRDAELVPAIEPIASGDGEVSAYRCSLAAALARAGRLDEAREVLDVFRADGYPVSGSMTWTYSMSELAEAAEVVGDRETAALVLTQAGRYPGHIANTGAHVIRPLDQALAQAALGVGDAAAAADHAGRAVAASRRNGTPAFLAREVVFLAEARRRLGASTGEVQPLVRDALTVAEPLGALVVAIDVERYGLPS
jgi:class 3 adenylate cyclase